MADFQNCLLSRIFSVFFERFVAQNSFDVLRVFFLRVFGIFKRKVTIFQRLYLLHAWAIAFARWPIFTIFCQLFPVFGVFSSAFLHRTTLTFL